MFFVEMLLVGAGVGLLSSALGLGGGILMVPAFLEFVPGMDAHTAKGTSLFIIVFVSAINVWHLGRKEESLPWAEAGSIAIGSIVGGYIGAVLTRYMSDNEVTWTFVVVVAFLSIRMLTQKTQPTGTAPGGANFGIGLAIGLVTGVISGMTGIGGGNIMVPLVILAGIIGNDRVVLLSNMVMIGTSLASTVAHLQAHATTTLPYTIGQVNFALAPVIFFGAQFGVPLGKIVNSKLTPKRRRVTMAVLLLVISTRMAYRALVG